MVKVVFFNIVTGFLGGIIGNPADMVNVRYGPTATFMQLDKAIVFF